MSGEALLIGEVARRTGASRKALRLYEEAGIVPAPRRSAAGYRMYDRETLALLAFVRQAQRLGFTLDEIQQIVALRRAGHAPCPRVRDLVRRKAADLDRKLAELLEVRRGLRALLNSRGRGGRGRPIICPRIEQAGRSRKGR